MHAERFEEEAGLEAILGTIPQALQIALSSHAIVSISDHKGDIVYVNDLFIKISGYSRAELIGRNHSIISSRYHSKPFFRDMWRTLKKGNVWSSDIKNRKKDGRYYWVASTIVPVTNIQGEITHYISIRTDITKSKEDAEAAMTAKAKQEHLFAIIGHELRTPAAALKMLFDEQRPDCHTARDRTMKELLDNLMGVLDDMRLVTRPELAFDTPVRVCTVANVINQTLPLLSPLLEKHGLNVEIQDFTQASEQVLVREQLLKQIILNLVRNCALHAQASTLKIDVASESKGSSVAYSISFSDNGMGISAAEVPRIFEAFERGEQHSDGTGLGLYIARYYAREIFNGDLTCNNNPSAGTVFKLICNLERAPDTIEPVNSEDTTDSFLSGIEILVVEDSDVLRMITSETLRKRGAIVTVASDGCEALKVTDQKAFDLILTDLFMPNLDGFRLTEILRKSGYEKPIVGLTAAVIGDETDRLKDLGATAVFPKPLVIENLRTIVS